MTQLSKERLEEISDYDTCVTLEESAEMGRRLLAAEAQEPVAWAHRLVNKRNGVVHPWVYGSSEASPSEGDIFRIEVMPLYSSPPVSQPVQVPECFNRLLKHAYGMSMGNDWNNGTMAGHHREALCKAVEDCRAAMLAAPVEEG
ncbi:hypothetical protein [Cronobacter universalis]|uniref:hypothetical protein n=1 Tax=Cronobacter universalis TaxID=535744 RepID=UPI003CEC07A5